MKCFEFLFVYYPLDIFGDEEDITVNSLEHHSDDDVMDHEPISKPEIQTFLPRNKKRKEVTKSFMDKDGYMSKILFYLT